MATDGEIHDTDNGADCGEDAASYGDAGWFDEGTDERDDQIEAAMPCLGAECVNPHRPHTYAECETAEMHRQAGGYEMTTDSLLWHGVR